MSPLIWGSLFNLTRRYINVIAVVTEYTIMKSALWKWMRHPASPQELAREGDTARELENTKTHNSKHHKEGPEAVGLRGTTDDKEV